MRVKRALALILPILLAACEEQPERGEAAQRITLEDALEESRDRPMLSPDTSAASWSVDKDGQAIHFGEANDTPLLTLDCQLGTEPPRMVIIRHAPALPGQTALFPIYGNGVRARFLADAALTDGEWRWEAAVPADDAQLDVLTGPREITATLPGRGMLEIAGSRIPGEFVEWCRAGGRMLQAEAQEAEDEGESEKKDGDEPASAPSPDR